MNWLAENPRGARKAADCSTVRSAFSAYLDGALTGVEMAALSTHLEGCAPCAADFGAWRAIQRCLGDLGAAPAPARLQSRLQQAIAAERARGSYLPAHLRILRFWQGSIAPVALQLGGGLAAALVLAGGLSLIFGAPIAVQANDDGLAHLIAPQYLYSQVPPEPIKADCDVPIVVEAMVDAKGGVYAYSILNGPRNARKDAALRTRIESNLLGSVFRPATVFGVPVRGHVVLTYTGVSVRG